MRKEEVDRVRGGLEIKGWGRERGEKLGKGRETEENFACAKRALLKEGSRETRGWGGGGGVKGGHPLSTLFIPLGK